MGSSYYDFTVNINRLDKLLLENIEHSLRDNEIYDISPMQALVITNIGHEEMRVNDVNDSDYYLGKNVTYNIKDLVKKGYVGRLKNKNDKRSKIVSLTKKGERVLEILESVNVSQQERLQKLKIDVNNLNEILTRFDRIF